MKPFFCHDRQRLLAAEQALERKERKAEKLERIFLAEEAQEQKILKQKLDAARAVSTFERTDRPSWPGGLPGTCNYNDHGLTNPVSSFIQEEQRYEKVEKEYEKAAALAKEDEEELRYVWLKACGQEAGSSSVHALMFPFLIIGW